MNRPTIDVDRQAESCSPDGSPWSDWLPFFSNKDVVIALNHDHFGAGRESKVAWEKALGVVARNVRSVDLSTGIQEDGEVGVCDLLIAGSIKEVLAV